MIQLAWRQFRTQALAVYGLLAVIAVVVVITGVQLVHYYDTYVATCGAHGDCGPAQTAFLARDHLVQAALGPIVLLLPALIGMFWGAPLIARELETGTFRLAWTQSMTRGRWLTVKIVMLGLASMAAAGLLSLAVTWWFSRIDQLNLNRFSNGVFEDRGIVPIGYAAFAFALGVTAGVLIRRTVPAMAATAVAVTAVLGLFWVKLDYLIFGVAPLTTAGNPIGLADGLTGPGPAAINAWARSGQTAGGWLVRGWYTQAGGHPMTASTYERVINTLLPDSSSTPPNPVRWLTAHHDAFQVAYQPGTRFWEFQTATAAVLLLVALSLAAAAVALVHRRGA